MAAVVANNCVSATRWPGALSYQVKWRVELPRGRSYWLGILILVGGPSRRGCPSAVSASSGARTMYLLIGHFEGAMQ